MGIVDSDYSDVLDDWCNVRLTETTDVLEQFVVTQFAVGLEAKGRERISL